MEKLFIAAARLGDDVKIYDKKKGGKYGFLSVASDLGYGDNKHTNWRKVFCSEKHAENLNKAHVKKGSTISLLIEEKITSVKTFDEQGEVRYYSDVRYFLLDWSYVISKKKTDDGDEDGDGEEDAPAPEKPKTASATKAAQKTEEPTDDEGFAILSDDEDLPF